MTIPLLPVAQIVKKSVCKGVDLGLIPGLGRSPGEGNGYSFQYFCLETPVDRGAWQATGHGVAQSDTAEQLTFSLFTIASESQDMR